VLPVRNCDRDFLTRTYSGAYRFAPFTERSQVPVAVIRSPIADRTSPGITHPGPGLRLSLTQAAKVLARLAAYLGLVYSLFLAIPAGSYAQNGEDLPVIEEQSIGSLTKPAPAHTAPEPEGEALPNPDRAGVVIMTNDQGRVAGVWITGRQGRAAVQPGCMAALDGLRGRPVPDDIAQTCAGMPIREVVRVAVAATQGQTAGLDSGASGSTGRPSIADEQLAVAIDDNGRFTGDWRAGRTRRFRVTPNCIKVLHRNRGKFLPADVGAFCGPVIYVARVESPDPAALRAPTEQQVAATPPPRPAARSTPPPPPKAKPQRADRSEVTAADSALSERVRSPTDRSLASIDPASAASEESPDAPPSREIDAVEEPNRSGGPVGAPSHVRATSGSAEDTAAPDGHGPANVKSAGTIGAETDEKAEIAATQEPAAGSTERPRDATRSDMRSDADGATDSQIPPGDEAAVQTAALPDGAERDGTAEDESVASESVSPTDSALDEQVPEVEPDSAAVDPTAEPQVTGHVARTGDGMPIVFSIDMASGTIERVDAALPGKVGTASDRPRSDGREGSDTTGTGSVQVPSTKPAVVAPRRPPKPSLPKPVGKISLVLITDQQGRFTGTWFTDGAELSIVPPGCLRALQEMTGSPISSTIGNRCGEVRMFRLGTIASEAATPPIPVGDGMAEPLEGSAPRSEPPQP